MVYWYWDKFGEFRRNFIETYQTSERDIDVAQYAAMLFLRTAQLSYLKLHHSTTRVSAGHHINLTTCGKIRKIDIVQLI